MLTDISHHYNSESNNIKIKSEIFEAEDVVTQFETNETCGEGTDSKEKILKLDENKCNALNYDFKIKSEICKTNDFKSPIKISNCTKLNKIPIKDEDKIENNNIKYEINEEFIIKEEGEQEDFTEIHNVGQQEPFLLDQNVPGNSIANQNDAAAAVCLCAQNQEIVQNIEIIKCQKCPKTYSTKEDLKIHHHIHTKKSICDLCQKSFSTLTHLRNHKILHTEKPYVCDVCQKIFTTSSNLKTHKHVHTGKKPHVCDVCQKKFNRKCDLRRHKLTHSGEKPHVCDVCQKTFNRKCVLRRHKLIHSGEQPYKCDTCQKTFTQSSNLKKHTLVHTGEKPYVCDVCQMALTTMGSLQAHKRIHSGEKPYKCDVCQTTFRQVIHLRSHKLVHSNDKPFTCDICQKAFGRRGYLRKHKIFHCKEVNQKSLKSGRRSE